MKFCKEKLPQIIVYGFVDSNVFQSIYKIEKMILINHKTGNHQLIAKYFEELAFHPLFQIVALINQAIISNRFQESKKPTTISIFSYLYHFFMFKLNALLDKTTIFMMK
jgi:hypothetical protein